MHNQCPEQKQHSIGGFKEGEITCDLGTGDHIPSRRLWDEPRIVNFVGWEIVDVGKREDSRWRQQKGRGMGEGIWENSGL